VSGCFTLAPAPSRERCSFFATSAAASNISRVTTGSCVGCSDQTHISGGLNLPPFLVALRFHTM
jgi:hypothetical protein